MMHGWGMGSFGMGFPLFGLIPLILIGGGLYILLRRRGTFDGSRNAGIPPRGNGNISGRAGASAPEIFRLAKRYDGVLTVSDVVSELGVDPQEAEGTLEGLTDGQRVDMQVDRDGVIRYVFREFMR
jgi:hypothetical protein